MGNQLLTSLGLAHLKRQEAVIERIILAVGVDPGYLLHRLPRLDCEIVFLPEPEAALDELWAHERRVVVLAVPENTEPDSGFRSLVDAVERHWPDIELLRVPSPWCA